uniref:Ribosome biogenesis regulatory protein n=1 Tax=Caenorhabditis japonica TaxID=281687 RepID=A0A8R1E2L1_CAEJA
MADKSIAVEKNIDPIIDLGNLLFIDREPILGDASEGLEERARKNTQLLFNNIWQLEQKRVEEAIIVKLPTATYRLPREKRLPEKKEPTKWEKYAAEKGIKKRKKDKKVFDEATKEWKPTYGYRRGNDNTKDWLIEIPDNAEDPNKDFFAERREKKKERVAKNEMQRMKNLARQMKTTVKTGPSTEKMIGVGVDAKDKTKQQVRFAVDRAKLATASAGKFQDGLKGEKANIKTGKKRKFEANEAPVSGEKERALQILQRMKSKKAKIVEEKAAAIAGPPKEQKEKKEKKGAKGQTRQKSQIHRQQWFKNKVDSKKKNHGAKKGGKK